MPTLSDLVQRTKQYMYGYTIAQQQFTYLSGSVAPGDVSFLVNDPAQLSRGIIEVDGGNSSAEMINLLNVNRTTSTAMVVPVGGRGYGGSTAVSHSANAPVENNPIFPQIRVIEAINASIRSVYPQVYAVGRSTITKLSVVYQYALAAGATEVISVLYDVIGPSQIQVPMINYTFQPQSNFADFAGVPTIYLGQDVTPGRQVTVNYKKEPTELVNLTDDFATVTGLPSTMQDAIVWRACANLAPSLDTPRLILDTVESNERAAYMPAGSASKVAQAFEQMALARLMIESQKQYDKFPIQTHNAY